MIYAIKRAIRLINIVWNKDLSEYHKKTDPLSNQGFKVEEGFLDAKTCKQIISKIEENLSSKSKMFNEFSYISCRAENVKDNITPGTDSGVRQIVHFQNIDSWCKETFISGRIEKIFEKIFNEKFVLESITAQIDEPSMTKRGFHLDGYSPQFKAFIYLNSISNLDEQPFTIIPYSHKYKIRQTINILYNYFWKKKETDLSLLFTNKNAYHIFGGAGTVILSNQLAAHKGWKQNSGKRRYILVCYLKPLKHYKNSIFSVGKNNPNLKIKNDLNTIRKSLGLKSY